MNCIEFEDLEDIFRVMHSEESGSLLGNFNSRVQLEDLTGGEGCIYRDIS